MIHRVLGFFIRAYELHRVAVVGSAGRHLSPAWCLAQEWHCLCGQSGLEREYVSQQTWLNEFLINEMY